MSDTTHMENIVILGARRTIVNLTVFRQRKLRAGHWRVILQTIRNVGNIAKTARNSGGQLVPGSWSGSAITCLSG